MRNLSVHLPLSLVLTLVSAAGCATTGLPPEAIEQNARGADLLGRGDLDGAEARFRLSLEYHPRFSEPRANLGVVAMERGDLEAAEDDLRSAIELNEDFAEAWGNLGVVLERQGRWPAAEKAYAKSLSINPGLVPPRKNLAALLMRRGQFAMARAHLMRVVALVPGDADAGGLLAYAEFRLGRVPSARARAEEVLREDNDAPAALFVRGLARFDANDYVLAQEDLEAAAKDERFALQAKVRLVVVALVREDLAAAHALSDALVREAPHDAAVHLVAARVALAEGARADAERHARIAKDLRPDLAYARMLLDEAHGIEGLAQ